MATARVEATAPLAPATRRRRGEYGELEEEIMVYKT
jgi:hypothetical protein